MVTLFPALCPRHLKRLYSFFQSSSILFHTLNWKLAFELLIKRSQSYYNDNSIHCEERGKYVHKGLCVFKNHEDGVLLIKTMIIIIDYQELIRKCKEWISLIVNMRIFKAFQWRLKLGQLIASEFHNFHHTEYNHPDAGTVLTTCGF